MEVKEKVTDDEASNSESEEEQNEVDNGNETKKETESQRKFIKSLEKAKAIS